MTWFHFQYNLLKWKQILAKCKTLPKKKEQRNLAQNLNQQDKYTNFTISKRKAKRPFPQRQSPANCILPKEGSITVQICDYNESRKTYFTEEDTNTFHQSLPKNAMM